MVEQFQEWMNECIFLFIDLTTPILYGYNIIYIPWDCFKKKRGKKGSAFHFQGEIWDEIQFSWYEAYFVEWLFDYCALVLPEYQGVFRKEKTYEGWWERWLVRPNWHIAFYGLRRKFSLVLKNMLYILICTILILFCILLSNFVIGFVDPKKVSNKKNLFMEWLGFFLGILKTFICKMFGFEWSSYCTDVFFLNHSLIFFESYNNWK